MTTYNLIGERDLFTKSVSYVWYRLVPTPTVKKNDLQDRDKFVPEAAFHKANSNLHQVVEHCC